MSISLFCTDTEILDMTQKISQFYNLHIFLFYLGSDGFTPSDGINNTILTNRILLCDTNHSGDTGYEALIRSGSTWIECRLEGSRDPHELKMKVIENHNNTLGSPRKKYNLSVILSYIVEYNELTQ